MEVIINSAVSIDGKISNPNREQIDLSSKEDWDRVDRLRIDCDAIMVGIKTILNDNPSLLPKNGKNPTRIVADSKARTPPSAKILNTRGEVIIGVGRSAPENNKERLKEQATIFETSTERTNLREVLERLEKSGYKKLMVEGGGKLNYSMIKEGLVDKIIVYTAPKIIGGGDSPTLVDGESEIKSDIEIYLDSVKKFGDGVLSEWKIQ